LTADPKRARVEGVYSLPPLPAALLASADNAVATALFALHGDLDRAVFASALEATVAALPALRSFFVTEHVEAPAQIVERAVAPPLTVEDGRGRTADEQATMIQEWTERATSALRVARRAPLWRMALVRIADAEYRVAIAWHLALLDRRSVAIAVRILADNYASLRLGRGLPAAPAQPCRAYASWVQGEDAGAARAWWSAQAAASRETPRSEAALPVRMPRAIVAAADARAVSPQALYLTLCADWATRAGARGLLTLETTVDGRSSSAFASLAGALTGVAPIVLDGALDVDLWDRVAACDAIVRTYGAFGPWAPGVAVSARVLDCEPPLSLSGAHLRFEEIVEEFADLEAFLRPLTDAGAQRTAPASYGQERLWFLQQLEGESTAYHAQGALRVEGDLRLDVLERALAEIIRRHEMLRTTFHWMDDRLVQTVHAPFTVSVEERSAREEDIAADVAELNGRPFDLEQGPLVRVTLLRIGPGESVLVLTIHHIVTDGWSRGIFFKELTALYAAYAAGEPSPLPALPMQYADYATRQRERMNDPAWDERIRFWTDALAEAPLLTTFATDTPRAVAGPWQGAMAEMALPQTVSAALARMGQTRGATLYMVLLAALKTLIARLNNAYDVVIGSPTANRDAAEIEPLIGFFVNALALRTHLDAGCSFMDALERVREGALDAYAFADVPFEKVVEALAPERDLRYNPLFQLFFNMQNVPATKLELAGLRVRDYAIAELPNRFDVTLYARMDEGRIRFELVYNRALYREATIERILEQFSGLLEQVAADPHATIGSYSLVRAQDRSVLPGTTTLAYDDAGAIHAAFVRQAARVPGAIAIAAEGETWTYAELDAFSSAVARRVSGAGCRPGDVVAVHGHACAALIGSVIGVLKAGTAFMIVDAALPQTRRRSMLDQARPAMLVCVDELAASLPWNQGPRLDLPAGVSQPLASFSDDPAVEAEAAPDGRSPAYVAFTSGSTGAPLGIRGTHGPVSHFLTWHTRTNGLGEHDRFSLLSGISHDPALRDIFTPLSLGASLHIPAHQMKEHPESLAAWFAREKISIAHLTPAIASLLASAEGASALTALRRVFFGGDRLDYGLVRSLARCAPACTFVNFYGATETPQAAAFYAIGADEIEHRSPSEIVAIGEGIDGVRILVRTERGDSCGVGELGEICVESRYLSEGYLDPAATSRRFLGEPGGVRLYRTGDVGRYRADGRVAIAGRNDDQVKIRGFRVEPRELQAALSEHPGVREVAAFACVLAGENALVAFVVPAEGAEIDAVACRRLLAERVPAYLVPASIVVGPLVPLTPNGKVDRAAIARLAQEPERREGISAPSGRAETMLARIWSEVLERPEIGADDDFFALGGHSLKAARVASRVARDFGVMLALRTFFERPRLRDLAAAIASAAPIAHAEIAPVPSADRYRASHAQRRIWSLTRLGNAAAYNMPSSLLLDGRLDRAALERALHDLTTRHEALRATFVMADGELWARPAETSLAIRHVDVRGEADPFAAARSLAEQDAAEPFSLDATLPVRVTLVQIAEQRHLLLVNVHHIVADGWSVALLIREFAALYEAAHRASALRLPPLRIQYKDYAAWQTALLDGPHGARDRDYWHRALAGPLPVLDLPADRARPPVRSGAGGRVRATLDVPLTEAIHAFGRERGVSLYVTLVAAVDVLLHRLSGQDEIIVGCAVAGRNHVELEHLCGCFVNMLALRQRIDSTRGFADVVASVGETVGAALEHQEYPFDRLIAELGVGRDVARSPVFDAVVVLQNAGEARLSLDGLEVTPLGILPPVSKFDLNVTFEECDGVLGFFIEYNADLFVPERIERMAAQLEALIRGVVAEPHAAIDGVNILGAHERAQLASFYDTGAAYPHARSIVDLFEEVAAARADAVAVLYGDCSLTYAELNGWANALARHLCDVHAVGTGMFVGIVMERSEALPVAILGVLKAGAAYVPIDPAYPSDRITFTLADAGCSVVVTDGSRADLRDCVRGALVEIHTLSDGEAGNLDLAVDPDDAAYVIYTSGSTGKPKGCVVTHGNVVRLLKNDAFPFDFGPRDTWVMAHSAAFDFSVWEMYGALLYGGRLVIADRDVVRNPALLRALLRRHRVSVLNTTPAAFYGLIEVERHERTHDAGDHLRYVIFGGDRLAPRQLRDWIGWYPPDRVALVNMYGITETTVHVTFGRLARDDVFSEDGSSPIGRPLPETRVYVCDAAMNEQPIGVPGELYVGGSGVCRGYLNRPDLNAARFVASPFVAGERLYRTGDVGRYRADGTLEYLGRNDEQIQLRGFRIELGEIRRVLEAHAAVREAVVYAWQASDGQGGADQRLVACVILRDGADEEWRSSLRRHAAAALPDYMIPAHVIEVDAIALTANGKVDYDRLPRPSVAVVPAAPSEMRGATQELVGIWQSVLRCESVGLDDSFFDLGGHSLLLIDVHAALERVYGDRLSLVDLFRYPTVRSLAEHLASLDRPLAPRAPAAIVTAPRGHADVAVVGMAGRFPGADGVEIFWENLCGSIESSRLLSDDELLAAGVPADLIADPRYVRRKPILDGTEWFDAELFGMSSREAEITDPQHRVFIESAWEALEHAGYDPATFEGRIGVYAAASLNSYLLTNLIGHRDLIASLGPYPLLIGNDRDFLATRTSYKLNLKGPSMVVGAACSGSMVAVNLAVQSLQAGQCEIALAGGVSIKVPQHEGYLYDEGGILSPDGRCRAFDARANGTVGASGVGIVVLKRLDDALRDRDYVHAVIRGIAVGNDGSDKIGYTAPSVEGQAAVIAGAQALAGVNPESITYVEAHGTGTSLGDPIEVAALTQAFAARTSRTGYCALGSVKTNVGHLDAAAGVTGLIKTALALDRGQIPPTLNFVSPNAAIDFAATPFFVNTHARSWERGDGPRRAGISSFGLGGTNVHAVLEEAPRAVREPSRRGVHLVQLSAPTTAQLDVGAQKLAAFLETHPDTDLADAAFTLAVGRRAFAQRRIVVAADAAGAAAALRSGDPRVIHDGRARDASRVVFMFPGGGSQYAGMARGLYDREPVFAASIDRGIALLDERVGREVRAALASGDADAAMRRPSIGLPALFCVEYSLAQLLQRWGIRPWAMIGHSLGEYTAACLAGVFSFEEAIALVAMRGTLFERIGGGAMLSVPIAAAGVRDSLEPSLSIAAVNLPSTCVVAGPAEAIDRLAAALAAREVETRRLHIDVAAHSSLLDPVLDEFTQFVSTLSLSAPRVPFVSNVSGTWITAEEARDPHYWAKHLRSTVQFCAGLDHLTAESDALFVEVGPGNTLASLAQRHPGRDATQAVLQTMRRPDDRSRSDETVLLEAVGRLWALGAPLAPGARYDAEARGRVPLPGFVFDRKRYWIDPPNGAFAHAPETKSADVASWLSAASMKRAALPTAAAIAPRSWLLVGESGGVAERLGTRLRERGHEARACLADEVASNLETLPDSIVFLAPLGDSASFDDFVRVAQAWLARAPDQALDLAVLTSQALDIVGDETIDDRAAAFHGPVMVIGQEHPLVRCRAIDVVDHDAGRALATIEAELLANANDVIVAYRNGRRWVRTFEALDVGAAEPRLRHGGVYLITGGTGGVGQIVARSLARDYQAHVVLLARTASRSDATALREIAMLGGTVTTIDGDVASVDDVTRAVGEAQARYGALHGVIHAAGITSGPSIFEPFVALTPSSYVDQARPKALGARVLARVLDGIELDFVLLISSNASVLGGLGLAAYAAANCALDAIAARANRDGSIPWISAGWDGWPTARRAARDPASATSQDRLAMTLDECERAFRLVLASPPGHVVVSSASIAARYARAFAAERSRQGDVRALEPARWCTDDEPVSDDVTNTLMRLWCDMLGLTRVGLYDNFFELRGDSLLGSRMITRLNALLKVRLPLRSLFEAPTIAGLREKIAELIDATASTTEQAASIPRLPDRDVYDLSHAQRRLWVIAQLDGGSAAYHIALALRLDGALDRDALSRALAGLVERHESLRTTFVRTQDSPKQRINAPGNWSLVTSDLTEASDPQAAADERVRAAADAPFDLERGPLFRAELIVLAAGHHVLVLAMHHIVSDGWSLSVLARELGASYTALRRNEAPLLAPLPIAYRDYAAWHNGRSAEDRDYWLKQLAGPLPVLDLPTDFPRPALRAFRGAIVTLVLDAQERASLEGLAAEHGASLFMVLCALVKVLIYRYTRQEDVRIGTPAAGRIHPDLEGQVGFYLNTLVLRDTVRSRVPFSDFLNSVRQTALDAYAHESYPFDELVDACEGTRDMSRSPLFDVQVSMQNAGSLSLQLDDVDVTALPVRMDDSKCDLTFDFDTAGEGLRMGIRYDSALFEATTVQRFGAHLRELAHSAARDPHTLCAELNLFPEHERRWLAEQVSGPACALPEGTLLDRFDDYVANCPRNVAAVFDGQTLTYAQLAGNVNRLARHLSTKTKPGDAVGIVLDRSIEMLTAMLAVLRCGCAYVPVDPAYPRERITHMLETADVRLVITHRATQAETGAIVGLLKERCAIVSLDADAAAIARCDSAHVSSLAVPGGRAYVLFTSGSTGRPKGVEIAHRSLLNFLLSMQQTPGCTAADVLLAVTTISFDIAGLELFLPLVCGGCVEIASAETARDANELMDRLRAGDVTIMQATPSTWQMLLAAGWEGSAGLKVLCGGEALSRALASELLARCGSLWNLYGPTETTIWSSVARITRDDLAAAQMTLGRPIHNTRIALLDGALQPVPLGAAGDAYIGGLGVALGYCNAPELTAERFLDDPFTPGERIYRTGDVARRMPDGRLEFLGRSDHQVKVRGYRIEIGEVEGSILRHGNVRETVVTCVPVGGEAALCAYVVPREGSLDVRSLREHLDASLPAYMIPSTFVTLEALPLAANGKVNRAALPAPAQPQAAQRVAPRSELERALARIWQDILDVEDVGIFDDFFELGGHSIKATRVVFRVQQELDIEMGLMDVFRNPTVAALGSILEARRAHAVVHADA